jgi:hypothetical protein
MDAAAPGTATAVSWDAALAGLLPDAGGAVRAPVHSRYRDVVNVLLPGPRLLALASGTLDDAPWTVRLGDWAALEPHIGPTVLVSCSALRLDDDRVVALDPRDAWCAPAADLSGLRPEALADARDVLRAAVREPATPFGRASAPVIGTRTGALRARLLDGEDGPELTSALLALVGLGEGLTPSGDDILTGLAFLAAQPGMLLGSRLPAIRRAIAQAADRTTLLSATTMAAAADGRGRQRFHDLAAAVRDGRPELGTPAVLAVGHSSGSDLLTGMSLALDVESELRALRDNTKEIRDE